MKMSSSSSSTTASSSSSFLLIFVIVSAFVAFDSCVAIRCAMCDTSLAATRIACLTGPPPPRECPEGLDFCINVAKYTTTGKLRYFTRTCSPFQSESACVPGTDRVTQEPIQMCYITCATDECNASRSLHHLLDFLRK